MISKEVLMKEAKKKKKKGQTWSIDMSIGVVIFLLLLILVYILVNPPQGSDDSLRLEADRIYSRLDQTRSEHEESVPLSIIDGTTLNDAELEALADLYEAQGYEYVRGLLGIQEKFCLVIVDEYGGIKNLSSTVMSIGDPADSLKIGETNSGTPIFCGE